MIIKNVHCKNKTKNLKIFKIEYGSITKNLTKIKKLVKCRVGLAPFCGLLQALVILEE